MHTDSKTPGPVIARKFGLNHGWTFLAERAHSRWLRSADPQTGTPVDLPHSWNEQDTFQSAMRYRQGHGSYQRSFRIPSDDARSHDLQWELVSEGFYGVGDLWLNGRRVCTIDGQYLGFRIDVTDRLNPATDNVVGIRLDNDYHPHVLPGKKMPDFLLHGGLAGQIHLEAHSLLHIAADSLRARCADPLASRPTLQVAVIVRNDGTTAQRTCVAFTLAGPGGDVVQDQATEPVDILPGAEQELACSFSVSDAQRWSPDHPALYHVVARLISDDTIQDASEKRFGIRAAEFRKDGFFLNGTRLRLRGANRHECMPGFGNALPRHVHRMDARLLKEAGLNLVRLAHYPQHPDFLDACDEFGIMVYAEIASWKSVRPGPWGRAAVRQMRAMLHRDRHHPAVILWGMGNESRSGIVFRALHRMVQQMDPTRATIYAENHLHRGARRRTLNIPDVLGVNYELDRLADAAALSRQGAVLVSECSNCPRSFRGDGTAERDQVETYERDIESVEGRAETAGYCLWSFNDYPTQRKHRIIRCPGIVDAWRLPKPAAFYLRARHDAKPFVHLDADWHAGETGSPRNVLILTNGTRVTVAINGRIVADQDCARRVQLELPFEAGDLVVTANHGGVTVSDTVRSYGGATQLALELEDSDDAVRAGGTTSALCRVLDADGQWVRNWTGELRVSISGPARARLHNAASTVPVAAGIGRIFLTGTGEKGSAGLRVEHDDLATAEATIVYDTRDADPPELPAGSQKTASLADWPRRTIRGADGKQIEMCCAGNNKAVTDAALNVWNGSTVGLSVQREHDWGGRVLIGPLPGRDGNLVFKHFAVRGPRYIYKARRAQHTLRHEERIRAAGFATARGLCLVEKRIAGVAVASLVVSEAVENAASVAVLINDHALSPQERENLLCAFAAEVGRWHRAGLFHGDMHINNVLCHRENGENRFVWIDNEEGRVYEKVPDEKRVHDLVHINRYPHKLTRAERLRMWRTYLHATGLTPARGSRVLRQVVARSLAYRRRRGWIN